MDVEMQWECEIDNNPIFDNRQPNMYRYYCWKKAKDRKATTINPKLLIKMVEEQVFFGMMEVDIEVPPHLMDHFEEFCPLFVTCSIPTEAIGDTMQQYIEEKNLSKLPRRQLVACRKSTPNFTDHSPAQLVPQTWAGGYKSVSGCRMAVPMMFEKKFSWR